MGQRHQLFVIAKINGKYRSLAAVHHQWLYGHTALRRCHGLLSIFGNPKNALALHNELKVAEAKSESLWTGAFNYNDVDVRFPFIMTCLILGASYCSEEGYLHRIHLEPFNMRYDGGDNNNGITIIDISNLDEVRYCFVDFDGMESKREVQLMTPLNAAIYVGAYYDLTSPEGEYMQEFVDDLEPWKIVTVEALEATWPGAGWEPPNHGVSEEIIDETLVDDIKSLSLRDRSLNKLIETIISSEEVDTEVIAQAEETLTDFWPTLKTKFYEQADTIEFNDHLLDMLGRSLQEDDNVDMSPFKKIDRDQLFRLVGRLTTGDYYLDSLNISTLLRKEDLLRFLGNKEFDIQTIYISEDELSAEEIAKACPKFEVHSANLIRRALSQEAGYKALPLLDFSPPSNPIVHVAWLTIPWSHLVKNEAYHSDGSLNYKNIKHVDTSRSRYHWDGASDNKTFQCRKYPLIDTALPISRFAGGLSTHIQWLADTEAKESATGRMHDAFACALALGASPHDLGGAVGPLSPALYHTGEMSPYASSIPKAGQWALVLIHPTIGSFSGFFRAKDLPKIQEVIQKAGDKVKLDPLKIYYALVSPKEGEGNGYEVIDIPTYCGLLDTGEAKKVAHWWQCQVQEVDHLNFYDFEDVQEMLKSIYSEQAGTPSEKEGVVDA